MIAVLAPMPSARDRTAVAANAGFRNKLRKASFIEGDSEQLSFQWAALNQRRCARTWAATVRSRIAPFGNGHSRVGQPILAAGKIACPTSNRPRQPTRARGGAGRNVQPQQSCQAQPSTEESESLRYQIGTSNEGRGGRCGATCPMPSPSTAWSCSHLATHKELVRKIEQIEAAQKQQARTRADCSYPDCAIRKRTQPPTTAREARPGLPELQHIRPHVPREARPGLPEIQHIRPHVPLGLQARAALHLIIRADLAHRGRDGVLVIRLVLGGNRRLRCPS